MKELASKPKGNTGGLCKLCMFEYLGHRLKKCLLIQLKVHYYKWAYSQARTVLFVGLVGFVGSKRNSIAYTSCFQHRKTKHWE